MATGGEDVADDGTPDQTAVSDTVEEALEIITKIECAH